MLKKKVHFSNKIIEINFIREPYELTHQFSTSWWENKIKIPQLIFEKLPIKSISKTHFLKKVLGNSHLSSGCYILKSIL